MCKQDGQLRVYGAGLLSSIAELKHAVSATDKIKRFDPEETVHEECIITAYQNHYYYTDSFQEATEKMRLVIVWCVTESCLGASISYKIELV